MWWPSPEAFEDLEVTDIEDGWQLSAPDDTELADWLNYWSQDKEHHEFFQTVFVKALTEHANFVIDDLEQNGKSQDLTDRLDANSKQAEDVSAGLQPEHEPGSDS